MESLTEKELICLINKLVDEKIDKDDNFLRFTFYEVMVKNKVINKQEIDFITLAKNKLNNMGYSVYLQGQEFIYNDKNMKVQQNELLVAIKDKNKNRTKVNGRLSNQSVRTLKLAENVIELLEENHIEDLEQLCDKSKTDLKKLKLNKNTINKIEIELQLLGLNLKNNI